MLLLLLATTLLATGCYGSENVVILLDASGSMQGRENETVTALNNLLANMSTTLEHNGWDGTFNVKVHTFAAPDRVYTTKLLLDSSLRSRPQIEREQYVCFGGTPLYDVVGTALLELPNNSTLVIATDGWDTTSVEFSRNDIAIQLDKAKKERGIYVIYVLAGDNLFALQQELDISQLKLEPGQIAVGQASSAAGAPSVAIGFNQFSGSMVATAASFFSHTVEKKE